MHDTDKYVRDGRLDVEAVRADGHGEGWFCDLCGENNPCSLAHAADRIEDFRDRPRRAT